MKFKVKDLVGTMMKLVTTRNVTLFESPEFGHMVVDGKMADTKVVDSGRLEMAIEISVRPGTFNAPMTYDAAEFKLLPGYFVSGAEISIHGLVIGKYACRYNYDTGFATYVVDVPEKYRHASVLLERQLRLLVESLS
jgi:hypothetical protein